MDQPSVKRCSTISAGTSGVERKRSIMGGLEVNRFKTFKKLVESKILSKSDRSLQEIGKKTWKIEEAFFREMKAIFLFSDPNGVCPSVGNGGPSLALGPTVGLNSNGKPNQTVTSTVLTAKDNFMRRSSRTSFTEIEVSLLNHMSRHNFSDLNLGGRRRDVSDILDFEMNFFCSSRSRLLCY